MQIANLRPPKSLAVLFHALFACIYLLLIIRAGISFYEGGSGLLSLTNNSLPTLLIKRFAGILYQPFYEPILFSPDGNYDLIAAIVLSILFYAMIHYGMFMNVSEGRGGSMAQKILVFCRAIFFLVGTLLLLIIVARMGVVLYQDVSYGRTMFAIPAKK
jgi:hypothetical protein